MNYGIQLYSLRDTMPEDMEGTLKNTAELGYHYVEFAGFFGKTPDQVNKILAENGLEVSGTHTGWQEVAENFDATVAYHKAIGNKNIIIPAAELDNQEKIDAFIEMVNKYQPKLKKEGIRLSYHNHDFEFKVNTDGSVAYDQIVERTSLELEIDTFWVYAAGKDPVALMEELKDRLTVIHIKDGLADGEGKPLGMGTAPVKAVYKKARELGLLMVVESETLTPDGLTEADICMKYLRSLE